MISKLHAIHYQPSFISTMMLTSPPKRKDLPLLSDEEFQQAVKIYHELVAEFSSHSARDKTEHKDSDEPSTVKVVKKKRKKLVSDEGQPKPKKSKEAVPPEAG